MYVIYDYTFKHTTTKLERLFSFPSSAKQEGRTCEYNGRIYQNGENFQPSCKHQCTCIDGAVGCQPLCPLELPLASLGCPSPRLLKVPGQCCKKFVCSKGPKKYKGVTFEYDSNGEARSNEIIYVGKGGHWKNLPGEWAEDRNSAKLSYSSPTRVSGYVQLGALIFILVKLGRNHRERGFCNL